MWTCKWLFLWSNLCEQFWFNFSMDDKKHTDFTTFSSYKLQVPQDYQMCQEYFLIFQSILILLMDKPKFISFTSERSLRLRSSSTRLVRLTKAKLSIWTRPHLEAATRWRLVRPRRAKWRRPKRGTLFPLMFRTCKINVRFIEFDIFKQILIYEIFTNILIQSGPDGQSGVGKKGEHYSH